MIYSTALRFGPPESLKVYLCAGAWQAVWPEAVDEVRAAGGRRGGRQEAAKVSQYLHSQHGTHLAKLWPLPLHTCDSPPQVPRPARAPPQSCQHSAGLPSTAA